MQTTTSRLASGTETIEAHQLRDGDVIVNSEGDEDIPVLLATRQNGLVFIWTTSTGGFGMSPSCTVQIARRNEIPASGLRVGDVVALASGPAQITHIESLGVKTLVHYGPATCLAYWPADLVRIERRNGGA